MIFVSYSHQDDEWCKRFLNIAKPLFRNEETELWTDKNIRPGGNWRGEIVGAMNRATVAVLLVSDNFLASDFIANEELPFLMDAARKKSVAILWVLVTPCLWKKTALETMQAVSTKPLIAMTEFEWKKTLCGLCEEIDKVLMKLERPIINRKLQGSSLARVQKGLQVLAEPARRETEILVYSGDGKWHTQSRVKKGSMIADVWIGDQTTKSGESFKIVAVTKDPPQLKVGSSHINFPTHRAKSEEVTVKRA